MQIAVPGKSRIAAIDLARGFALLTMAVYHFAWDLEFFGYARPGLTAEFGWVLFARAIAGSFLFLVGVSLILAHGNSIKWRGFWTRFAQVTGAALAITTATYFAMPGAFIFFGILHAIALSSLIGLLFLRAPWWVTLIAAITAFALPQVYSNEVFANPALLWTGLAPFPPRSNDYVPIFPWFGAVLLGMSAARLALNHSLFERMRTALPAASVPAWLQFPGRHSLAVYLIHQPVLISLVWLATQVSPPVITVNALKPSCERQCEEEFSPEFCTHYCLCTLNGLKTEGILKDVATGGLTIEQSPAFRTIRDQCTADAIEKSN